VKWQKSFSHGYQRTQVGISEVFFKLMQQLAKVPKKNLGEFYQGRPKRIEQPASRSWYKHHQRHVMPADTITAHYKYCLINIGFSRNSTIKDQ
jgi:hypothetical protein